MYDMRVKFVSKKVSKIRWRPQSSTFVTGSWDDEENKICLWICPGLSVTNDVEEGGDVIDPPAIVESSFSGGVTDLKVASNDFIFASSTNGSVYVYKYTEKEILQSLSWDRLHHFAKRPASCTGISVKGNDIASVGEDGRLYIHNFLRGHQLKTIESTDLCALTAVSYLRYQEIVVGNILGYLRVYDLRSSSHQPSYSLSVSADHLGITSLNHHPTQGHILATGHEDGTLCIWDTRQRRQPTAMLSAHSASVTEVLFHPVNPDFLYTCSIDGSVLQWDSSPLRTPTSVLNTAEPDPQAAIANPWLSCDTSKHRLEISSLCSQSTICINSMDLLNNTLLWCADNEAVYYIDINI